jgi:hypothetical protein
MLERDPDPGLEETIVRYLVAYFLVAMNSSTGTQLSCVYSFGDAVLEAYSPLS